MILVGLRLREGAAPAELLPEPIEGHDLTATQREEAPVARHQPQFNMLAPHQVGESDFQAGITQEGFRVASAERPGR